MENISKAILKRRGNHGWVIYEYGKKDDNEFTLAEIEELFDEIKKDFPDTDSEKIKIEYFTSYTGMVCLRMSFYCTNLPERSHKFIETISLDDFHDISHIQFYKKQKDLIAHGFEIMVGVQAKFPQEDPSCEKCILAKGDFLNTTTVEINSKSVSKYNKVIIEDIQDIDEAVIASCVNHAFLMATADREEFVAVAYNVWRIKRQILIDKVNEKTESDVTEIFNKEYSFISQEDLEYRLLCYFSVLSEVNKELHIRLR